MTRDEDLYRLMRDVTDMSDRPLYLGGRKDATESVWH
jgi:hypothetical protein